MANIVRGIASVRRPVLNEVLLIGLGYDREVFFYPSDASPEDLQVILVFNDELGLDHIPADIMNQYQLDGVGAVRYVGSGRVCFLDFPHRDSLPVDIFAGSEIPVTFTVTKLGDTVREVGLTKSTQSNNWRTMDPNRWLD